jgi:predicted N-acetyltransferase YhbS
VLGYSSLAAGAVVRSHLGKAKLRANLPDQVPIVVLGRLAVDLSWQRRGVGQGLLKDGILRALGASEMVGIRAIVVHAIDEAAIAFYRRFGFLDSPLDARTLLLPLETARSAM